MCARPVQYQPLESKDAVVQHEEQVVDEDQATNNTLDTSQHLIEVQVKHTFIRLKMLSKFAISARNLKKIIQKEPA